ncbi:MAG: hypothetical protein ACKOQM_05455 [Novosphingobium sp.]
MAEQQIQGAQAAQDAAAAWQKVHADPSIQYAPVEVKLPQTQLPDWLVALEKFFKAIFEPIGRALGLSWPVLQWVLLGLAVLLLAYVVWRFSEPLRLGWQRKQSAAAAPEEWTPDRAEALALLEDADALAREGRYDEATHLLLRRSVHQIAQARPDWVGRASTAREIGSIAALPDKARATFAQISGLVERSLFALRALNADDWQAARQAYAEFALERIGAAR